MSIRPTERKDSAYSAVEAPPSDVELKKKEAKNIYYIMLIFIAIDYILTSLIIIKESYFFKSDKENEIILFLIKIILVTVFFLFVVISLIFLNIKLTKIMKYIFIIITVLYYIFEIIISIKYFIDNFSDLYWLDILFFLLFLITIIPRIFFIYYIGLLIIKINEMKEYQKGEEHDNFRQNLENKMERGDDTNWSKTSLPTERKQQSQFLSGNNANKKTILNNEGDVNTIKENYIEEDKED